MNWVSVEDKYPEHLKTVAVWYDNGLTLAHFNRDRIDWTNWDGVVNGVTHWIGGFSSPWQK